MSGVQQHQNIHKLLWKAKGHCQCLTRIVPDHCKVCPFITILVMPYKIILTEANLLRMRAGTDPYKCISNQLVKVNGDRPNQV